jgi:hypothetical protein
VKFLPRLAPRCFVQASVSCLSHPLACCLACGLLASRITTEASHRSAAPTDRCHRRCTTAMPVPSTQRQCLTQCLDFLLPCWHRVRLHLASSCLAPCRVGTVCWHANARRVATTSPPVQLTSSPLAYRQKCLRRRLHASSYQLLLRCALRPCMHARTIRARSCAARRTRAVPSPSLCAPAYTRRPPSRLASVPATLSVSSHLTPPLSPCVGSRASPEPRAAPRPEGSAPSPSLSSGAIDRAGELRLSVVRPPRFYSAPGIVSGRCAEVDLNLVCP